MPDLHITAADIDENRYYKHSPSIDCDGSVLIDNDLGTVLVKESILANVSIVAGTGSGIEAGSAIEAGANIRAGKGIKAGWGINAKFVLAKFRIFAGLVNWRMPTDSELEIRAELRGGTIEYGKLVAPIKPEQAKEANA